MAVLTGDFPGNAPAPGAFRVARLPEIRFGAGSAAEIAELAARYGQRLLVVTGGRSFVGSAHWTALQESFRARGLEWEWLQVTREPSPCLVDAEVARCAGLGIQAVLGIGGGSVLDAAKAIAGLLPSGRSVMDYLEGVGRGAIYTGPALPLIAVPTTAGTGSEATANAVLSMPGERGFKKSFRGDALVPQVAIVDPTLLESCPPELIAANGMDAFTQLLESLVSTRASAFTDALAWSGLRAFRDSFWLAWAGEGAARSAGLAGLAYASLLSGITLAQAGLGSVHGLAAPLGAYFPVPHGVVCGTLVAAATECNLRALRLRAPAAPALVKYAGLGRLLCPTAAGATDTAAGDALSALLHDWQERLALPRLGQFGMTESDIGRVVAGCRGGSMRTNPLVLEDEELAQLLRARL
jgi:alcohol dehydrogenase class IV